MASWRRLAKTGEGWRRLAKAGEGWRRLANLAFNIYSHYGTEESAVFEYYSVMEMSL